MENPESKEMPFFETRLKFLPASWKDLERIEKWLHPFIGKSAAQQCAFVLRSMSDEDFRNHCDEAVKEFGRRLAYRFGDEESFFDLARHARFGVTRSYSSTLDKVGYQNTRHHDVALLEFENPKGPPFSLVFDLVYGVVAAKEKNLDKSLALFIPGTGKKVLEALEAHYGGKWRKEMNFNPENGHFVYR